MSEELIDARTIDLSEVGPVQVLDEQDGNPCAVCGEPMDGWVVLVRGRYAHCTCPVFGPPVVES